MTNSKMANRYSLEVRARAVRMVFEHQGSYETQAGAIAAIAPKIDCIPQTLCSMLWSKHCRIDGQLRKAVWFITRTAPLGTLPAQCPAGQWAGNICLFDTPSVCPKLVSNHRSAALATVMTTPSLRRLTASTKPN